MSLSIQDHVFRILKIFSSNRRVLEKHFVIKCYSPWRISQLLLFNCTCYLILQSNNILFTYKYEVLGLILMKKKIETVLILAHCAHFWDDCAQFPTP